MIKSKGFTLVEVILAMVITSIMGTFIFRSFQNNIDEGRARNLGREMKIFKRAMKFYYLKQFNLIDSGSSAVLVPDPGMCVPAGTNPLVPLTNAQKNELNEALNIHLGTGYDITCQVVAFSNRHTFTFHTPSYANETYQNNLDVEVEQYFSLSSDVWGTNTQGNVFRAVCPNHACE